MAKKQSKVEDTLLQRGSVYGSFHDNAVVSQGLKDIMRGMPGWKELADDMRESLDMIVFKISRILTGDPTHADNWHDIAGYAELIRKRLEDSK